MFSIGHIFWHSDVSVDVEPKTSVFLEEIIDQNFIDIAFVGNLTRCRQHHKMPRLEDRQRNLAGSGLKLKLLDMANFLTSNLLSLIFFITLSAA